MRSLIAAAMSGRRNRRFIGDESRRETLRHDGRQRRTGFGAFEQAIDERRERNLRISVIAHGHLAVQRLNRLAQIDLGFRDREIGIAQNFAEQEQAIGFLDQPGHFGQAGDHPCKCRPTVRRSR